MASPTSDRRLGLVGNVAIKAPVAVVATAAVAVGLGGVPNGEQTIDGIVTSGSRVLLTAQADPTQNGIWDTNTADWTRSLDCDGVYDVACGTIVSVNKGSHASQVWMLTTPDPVSIGSSALAWSMNLSMTFLATLAGGGGAALVGFLQAGANAQLRTMLDKMREVEVSIADYAGFDATQVTVSDAAIQAAIDYVHGLPNGGTVRLASCSFSTVTMRDNVALYIPKGVVLQQVQPATNVLTGFVASGSISHFHVFGLGRIDGGRGANPVKVDNTVFQFALGADDVVNDVSFEGIQFSNTQRDAIFWVANDLTALAQDLRIIKCRSYVDDASLFESTNAMLGDLYRLQQSDNISNGYGTYQFKHILADNCSGEQIRTLIDLKRGCAFFVVKGWRTKNMYDDHVSVDGSSYGTISDGVMEVETDAAIASTFGTAMEIQGNHIGVYGCNVFGGDKLVSGIIITPYGRPSEGGQGHFSFKVTVRGCHVDDITTNGYRIIGGEECVIDDCEASFCGAHLATMETAFDFTDADGNPIPCIGSEIGDINNKQCEGVSIAPESVNALYSACYDVLSQDNYDIATPAGSATTLLVATQAANFRTKHPAPNMNANPNMGPVVAGAISYWSGTASATTGVVPPNGAYGLALSDSSTSFVQSLDYSGMLSLADSDNFFVRIDVAGATTAEKFGVRVREFGSTGGQLGSDYWYGIGIGSTSYTGYTLCHTGQDAACDHISLGLAPAARFAGDAASTGTVHVGNVRFGRQAFGAL